MAEFKLSEIMSSKGHVKTFTLVYPPNPSRVNGTLKVSAEEVMQSEFVAAKQLSVQDQQFLAQVTQTNNNLQQIAQNLQYLQGMLTKVTPTVVKQTQFVNLSCTAFKLDKKDLFGKSDPYFIVYKQLQSGEKVELYVKNVAVLIRQIQIRSNHGYIKSSVETQKNCIGRLVQQ